VPEDFAAFLWKSSAKRKNLNSLRAALQSLQLVTELGFRMSRDEECEYVIVSNDTGFDAVVRYWTRREMSVRRLSGKDCHKQLTQQTNKRSGKSKTAFVGLPEMLSEKSAKGQPDSEVSSEMPSVSISASASETVSEQTEDQAAYPASVATSDILSDMASVSEVVLSSEHTDDIEAYDSLSQTESEALSTEPVQGSDAGEEIRKLCCCISSDNLADFHNALVMLYGEEEGKDRYQHIKSDPDIAAYWKDIPEHSLEEKFDIYCRLVFATSDIAAEDVPEDFAAFLWKSSAKRKNLNSLRAALQSHYGKERGMKYYSLFKSHIKILNRM
jgi:hypothetical protein